MRSKSIFSFTVVAMTFVILLFSCSREIDSSIETNDFIQRFLDINSVRLYKSEIKRVKVNYFPASTMIVYSFWKQERFNTNGNLFLHLYPADSNNLQEHRKINKFVNLPIGKDSFFRGRPPYFYYFENLQLPYSLSLIRSGQYNETGKTWSADFDDKVFLSKELLSKKALLKGKNSLYSINILNDKTGENLNSILGTKIYQSKKHNKPIVYYNASLNRITYLFDIHKIIDQKLFVDIYTNGQFVKRNEVSFIETVQLGEWGLINYDIPLKTDFNRIEIIQIINGVETVLKSLDKKTLIHNSFPLKQQIINNNLKDKEIEIVNNLIFNNLPLMYFNLETKFKVFLNEKMNRAYIVSGDMNCFDSMNLESIVLKDEKEISNKIRLKNSFFIDGESKQIVVHELKLSNGEERIELIINSNEKELYRKEIKPID